MLSPYIDAKAFARDSFVLPEAKRDTEWIDPDTLVLSSSYGRDMATTSGYARTVRLWRRDTGADQAPVIFDIAADHGSAHCNVDHTVATARMWFVDQVSARPGELCSTELHHHRGHDLAPYRGQRDWVTRDRDIPRAVAIACIAVVAHQASHVVEVNAFVFAYRSQVQADVDEHLNASAFASTRKTDPLHSSSFLLQRVVQSSWSGVRPIAHSMRSRIAGSISLAPSNFGAGVSCI